MNMTEDYLDGLLNSLDEKEHKDAEPEVSFEDSVFADTSAFAEAPVKESVLEAGNKSGEQDFLNSFEQEFLSGEDTDEFIRQFERELSEENSQGTLTDFEDVPTGNTDDFTLDNLSLDNGMSLDDMSLEDGMPMEAGMSLDDMSLDDNMPVEAGMSLVDELPIDDMTNTLGDVSDEMNDTLPGNSGVEISEKNVDDLTDNDEQDLMDLLGQDGDFSDMGDILDLDEKSTEIPDDFAAGLDDFTFEEPVIDNTMIKENASEEEAQKKKGETSGFLKKISQALFGEENDEIVSKESLQKASVTEIPDLSNLSADELLLMELEGKTVGTEAMPQEETPEPQEDAKAKKKRENAEKKAKKAAQKKEKNAEKKAKKAEKEAKKKAEKEAKKEKKMKKPKEPDNTPPLPKKPVILCFVMVASFLALVILGTQFSGYTMNLKEAEEQFEFGNYAAAYQRVSGLEIKEKDSDTYEKYRVMGIVTGEYDSYQTFMEAAIYDMALDSLVRAVGRCEKYMSEAELYGCVNELEKLREQAVGALAGFGLTEEHALELYAIEEREDYSIQINTILKSAGYQAEQGV